MLDLRDVDRPALLDAFENASEPKAVERLLVALAYTDGVAVATISERYGIPEQTCYAWLNRFADGSIRDAITDDSSTGRPSKLTREQRECLESDLASPPGASGYDAEEWSDKLLQRHVESTYSVEYSTGHARRLLSRLSTKQDG